MEQQVNEQKVHDFDLGSAVESVIGFITDQYSGLDYRQVVSLLVSTLDISVRLAVMDKQGRKDFTDAEVCKETEFITKEAVKSFYEGLAHGTDR